MGPIARCRCVAGVLLGLTLVGPGAPSSSGVGPPAAGPVKLTAEQQLRLARLHRHCEAAASAGEMGRALRLGQEVESLHRQWQGPRHWQAVDARYQMEGYARLASLRPEAQRKAGRAWAQEAQASRLRGLGLTGAADQKTRQALALWKESVGDHPAIVPCYNNLALHLQEQRKFTQAQDLFEKAMAIRQQSLGEGHPELADSYTSLARCFSAQGKYAQALPLYRKAVAINRKMLGDHPRTADSVNGLASCLKALGKGGEALGHLETALSILRKVRGDGHVETYVATATLGVGLLQSGHAARAQPHLEAALAYLKKVLGKDHPFTGPGYNNLALCLEEQGKTAEALALNRTALAISRTAWGEKHAKTAVSYNNIATCLIKQGQFAQALPLLQKALAIETEVVGEGQATTATTYNNLAQCLRGQGKLSQALALNERALTIRKQALGEGHPETAVSYANAATCLVDQGKAARAQPLYEKALAIFQKSLGEGHPHTVQCHAQLAGCLRAQGKATQALALYEKALARLTRSPGKDHPTTGLAAVNTAFCLDQMGQHDKALPLYEMGLTVCKKTLGEDHPVTSACYNNLASCLEKQGKFREAVPYRKLALRGHDAGRLSRAEFGFDRARADVTVFTPRVGLALAYARLEEPEQAWQHAEAELARNLLDDLAGALPEEAAGQAELRRLDERLASLFGRDNLAEDQKVLRDELMRQRRELLARRIKQAVAWSASLVWSLKQIQEQLPADAALLMWVGGQEENWGCVIRAQGAPRWVRLAGSGARGAWTSEDYTEPLRLFALMASPNSRPLQIRSLTEAVRRRWFTPLGKHLKGDGKLPAVSRLFVVHSRHPAGLPVEALAPGYRVSFTPSATVLAQALRSHRELKIAPALALGDPAFPPPALELSAPPTHGLLLTQVLPNSNASRAGLRAGDVLLQLAGVELRKREDLVGALEKSDRARARYWRDGKNQTVELARPLGVRVDERDAPTAVRSWRETSQAVKQAEQFTPLPGTRAEVQALRRLLGKDCTTLLGSEASEQKLDAMAKELKRYRVLHLATHGEANLAIPERSRLILARDRLPGPNENAARAAGGKPPYTGELTVDTILREWKLDADLVVLSACQTGLGARSSGDGPLGFSYALMRVGARSVVLSRWKVDDTATALLMVRFYENLLGQAKGLKGPMGRADALAEAKRWLAGLPRKEAEKLAVALGANRLSGTRGSIVDLVVKEGPKLPAGERPYAHPFYWAAFTLVGDPD